MTDSPTSPRGLDRSAVNAIWLLRLRWVAVIGQLVTIGVTVGVLDVRLPTLPLLSIVAFTALTNGAFAVWLRRRTDAGAPLLTEGSSRERGVLATVMTLDLVSLTGLLYFSGGPANPFVIFYFVNLALAAVVLPSRWGWSMTLLAISCLVGLLFVHVPLPELDRTVQSEMPIIRAASLQEIGLIVALATCGGVAVYFITRVTRELRDRENQLRIAELRRSQSERLEALATLAAGAGHELASPLSTIAVIAKDLARHLEGTEVPETVIEDVGLIRSELDHCRRILNEMSSSAGEAVGEVVQAATTGQLIEEVLHVVRRRERVHVNYDAGTEAVNVVLPLVGVAQAIRGILRNALDASDPSSRVAMTVSQIGDELRVEIADRGTGMPPDVLARASEPFFTTKQPGQGMGLGLFLAHNVFARLGGSFGLVSEPGVGTTAIIRIPLQAAMPTNNLPATT